MGVRFFNRKIDEECHQKMRSFAAAGDDIVWVAFPPGGGNRWSIVAKSGAYFNRNIPEDCHKKMGDLSQNGAKITRVAFTPQGGWSVVNDKGIYFNHNIPEECQKEMGELSKNGSKIVSVAFYPQGTNNWSIVNDKGLYINRNIPDECHQKMGDLSKNGAKIVCVAFPPQGGNSWSIVNDHGAYFNRNIPEEAHMYMGFFTEVYGPVRIVAFDADGSGWSVTAVVTLAEKVCDDKQCVLIADVYHNIQTRLNGNVVGYACTVGKARIGAFSHGQARTSADAPSKLFLPSTKIPVASVSKVITTLGAIPILHKNQVSLDAGIGKYVPSDWKMDPLVAAITFRQLLTHKSGIRDYGNVPQDYASLKAFFTKPLGPTNPINPNDKSPMYSNYNFSIFRILLPIVNGFKDDSPDRAAKLAAAYIAICQKYVFEPVGAIGVDTKPPSTGPQATGYAYSYMWPGTSAGWNWGDDTLEVGAAGWYLAIDDIAKVLYSINKNDGRILTQIQRDSMIKDKLGWDTLTDSTGYRWVEKNGGWGANGTSISTTIALFGPDVFAALFCNSDIAPGPNYQTTWRWCKKCQSMTFAGNPNQGKCPAGDDHDHTGSSNFAIRKGGSVPPGSQSNWRWCNKCQALAFAGNASLGPCSAGGMHDHGGSGDYVLPIKGGGGVPEDTQDNWRWCNKCQVLAFAGNASLGPCAAGGQHNHTGSGDYIVTYQVGADTVLREAYMKALKPK